MKDKIMVRVSVVDELGRCVAGRKFVVAIDPYLEDPMIRRYLEKKLEVAVLEMIQGE